MGSPKDEKGRDAEREGTRHKVQLTKPFYLGKYEVTQAEWQKVMGANPSELKREQNPIDIVSWPDGQGFITKMNEHIASLPPAGKRARGEGASFALPTEAQWEYACRAGSQTRFCYGDDLNEENLKEYAWYKVNSGNRTHAVGGKRPNAWGLYDMHGNVWEWCRDSYGAYPAGEARDPTGPEGGARRAFRGGSSFRDGYYCRSAFRHYNAPLFRLTSLGCRVALNIPLTLARPAAAGGELPRALAQAFEVPTEAKDQHGNPIRAGRDEKTGLPLEIRHRATGMHLVFIPAGEFVMGSPEHEEGRDAEREGKRHKVQLTKPFYLGKYEVTQPEWQKLMPKNPSYFIGESLPVDSVRWPECQGFVKRLNTSLPSPSGRGAGGEGPSFALPTEAQWEYACRAGTQTPYSFGGDENELGDHAWYRPNHADTKHPVGQKKPNNWGLYDMHGNAWEWCEDWYGPYPTGELTDPTGPDVGTDRILRGGSGWNPAPLLRSARRQFEKPSHLTHTVGCRLVLNIPLTLARPTAAGDGLPQPLAQAFEVPAEAKDQHGNPVRQGTDKDTGLPLEIRHKLTGMSLVFIPAGEFLMGSPKEEKGRDAEREGTQHKVVLTKPFYMGKYEVAQGEWQKVTGGNPGQYKGDRNPVENVTWAQCQEFVTKLDAGTAPPASRPPLISINRCVLREEPGFLRLTSPTNDRSWAATEQTYSTPVRICLRARTDSTNIRIRYGHGFVIFNWEADLKRLVVGDLLKPGEENEHYVPGKGYLVEMATGKGTTGVIEKGTT